MCSGSVKQANTSSRGACKRREMANSFSVGDWELAWVLAADAFMAALSLFLPAVSICCGGGVVTNNLRRFLAATSFVAAFSHWASDEAASAALTARRLPGPAACAGNRRGGRADLPRT